MHMADALLSPAVGMTFWGGTLAALGLASRQLKRTIDDRMIPLMGVLGAFIFAAQMINFTIPGTGSSGHLGGGMILVVLLGPSAAFLVLASVLTVQGLFFADGGLLALGCNIWNLGIYPCFIAYPLLYRPLAGDGTRSGRVFLAAVASAAIGLQLGSFSVVLQTLLSGMSELPFTAFAMLMQSIHLGIGIVEGLVTAGVVKYVHAMRPELLAYASLSRPVRPAMPMGKVLAVLTVLTMIVGGALSWFASTHPDGLEWSIERVLGRPDHRAPEQEGASLLKDVQDHTALMPGYAFRDEGRTAQDYAQPAWPGIDAGTSTAGIVGASLVLVMVLVLGFVIRMARSKHT